MLRRDLGATAKVLGAINAVVKRYYDSDSNFTHGEFTINDFSYVMNKDGSLYRKCINDADGEYKFVRPSGCKGNIYSEYTINNTRIKSYILSMTVANDKFYDLYMSDKRLNVNHTVVERLDYYAFNNNHACSRPNPDVAYNPAYLEVVTNSANTRHGKFVNKYELYGIYVSASDIDALLDTKSLIDPNDDEYADKHDYVVEHNRCVVLDYYRNVKNVSFELCP